MGGRALLDLSSRYSSNQNYIADALHPSVILKFYFIKSQTIEYSVFRTQSISDWSPISRHLVKAPN